MIKGALLRSKQEVQSDEASLGCLLVDLFHGRCFLSLRRQLNLRYFPAGFVSQPPCIRVDLPGTLVNSPKELCPSPI